MPRRHRMTARLSFAVGYHAAAIALNRHASRISEITLTLQFATQLDCIGEDRLV